ncbi:hypothetical protein [Corynebacterium pseudotuberculosis]|uniref:DUF7768 domain-containing protein n=1 Tax=Corynebacterium pseudotuberculosis TaxID=1719 RepID=UPI000256B5C7|nr:hypothetical protein [Corynebacterium pseudotuberculosis]AFF22600.1 Hypothetical protein CpP54B96_1470 [Corynebacterium pseudotuberculosis P54B96]MEA1025172.1 hypothetical protein [Corynebacterium pseudotuberculosis]
MTLAKAGIYPYADHGDFELLLFGYLIDASPVEVIDLVSGEQLPSEVLVSLVGPADEFAAHRIRLPPLVYICSPYSGDVEINVQLAHDFCARAVIRGAKIRLLRICTTRNSWTTSAPDDRELAMFFNRILLPK